MMNNRACPNTTGDITRINVRPDCVTRDKLTAHETNDFPETSAVHTIWAYQSGVYFAVLICALPMFRDCRRIIQIQSPPSLPIWSVVVPEPKHNRRSFIDTLCDDSICKAVLPQRSSTLIYSGTCRGIMHIGVTPRGFPLENRRNVFNAMVRTRVRRNARIRKKVLATRTHPDTEPFSGDRIM